MIESVLSAIDRFQHGSIDLEDLQDRTRSALHLVKSTQQHLKGPLALAEADLEEIRLARSEDRQRPEALAVVERLRHGLQHEPSGHRSDLVTDQAPSRTTIVVERRCFEVSVVRRTARSMVLSVVCDGEEQLTSEVAGWRPWACGVAGGQLYIWTARQVIALPDPPSRPVVFNVDEDLLLVVRTSFGWVLVCETSVRTSSVGGSESRLELDQVVELARWERGLLVVQDACGVERRLAVSVEGLEEVSSDHDTRARPARDHRYG